MAAIFFPFPYLAPESSVVTRGSMFDIPIFCKRNIKSHVCKNFYRNIDPSVAKFHLCPYGFGVEVVKFDSESVIFTCLNIVIVKKLEGGFVIMIFCLSSC